jgi:hypothetical protein
MLDWKPCSTIVKSTTTRARTIRCIGTETPRANRLKEARRAD